MNVLPKGREKDTKAEVTVGLVGLGYVGLPTAVAFAEAGCRVIGLDVDRERIEQLNAGESFVEDVSNDMLGALIDSGRLTFTSEYQDLKKADAILIAVPTPLTRNREPDLGAVLSASKSISEVLRRGQLVVLESTSFPGTTREHVVPLLEESGLTAGVDFHVAFAPERIDPGRQDFTLKSTVKVVGGLSPECADRAADLYRSVVGEVLVVSSPETAELTKLLENIFRAVNIALVNELAVLCDRMEIDVWEVVDAAATKPFGFMRFEPGPGLGGHCLPIDPFYLAWKARQHDFYTEFIELAGKINQNMPYFCVQKIDRALNDRRKSLNGSSVAFVGVAYKPGVGDLRESPALKIMDLLAKQGAKISYHDTFVPELPARDLVSRPLEDIVPDADLVLIVTGHPGIDYEALLAKAELVVDFRGVLRGTDADNLVRL